MTTPSISATTSQYQVQLRLGEIALGGFELGLGLLHRRCFRRQPVKGEVDVAFGGRFLEGLQHLLRRLVVGMDDAELSRALHQVGPRLEDGGEGLIEIGRDLAEISALGLRRQS